MLKKYFPFFVLGMILILYILIRIKPLQFQTVAYTYDQGRDFLKAAEMVMNRKPTFIGPTTGINGLYHGAWWYYVLAIPFVLFRGLPIGYYYFNLLIHIGSLVAVFYFVKKYFGLVPAAFAGLLITVSPYFAYVSLFVGNNIMVLPVMLGFLIVNFKILEDKKGAGGMLLAGLAGLFLGLIGEFELSFGLFLIPAYMLGIILFKRLRVYFIKPIHGGLFLLGLGIAFLPRALFELKNQFIQTKTLLSFFFQPKLYNPKPYFDVLKDRIVLFRGYWEGLFPNTFTMLLISVMLVVLLAYIIKNKSKVYVQSLLFFTYVIAALFMLSTLYKDSFWANYYEGIQYIFLFVMILILSSKTKFRPWESVGYKTVALLFLALGLWQAAVSLRSVPKLEGLAAQEDVISYVLSNEKNTGNYCVRVYTPPVIPHTYNYLFTYEKLKRSISLPGSEWVNGNCWFIMEDDPFKFRLQDWKKVNEPEQKAKVTSKWIQNVLINHFQVQ